MEILKVFLLIFYSYLIGSIPFGLLLVHLRTGKDIRTIESGRTGGTNAARAAGALIGVTTALLDGSKATSSVWIAQYFFPSSYWLHILAPIFAIVGHNYSIFLIQKTKDGKLHIGGGAGGAPCAGGAVGLWFPSLFIVAPITFLIIYLGGYASVATLSIAFMATIIFAIRAIFGIAPWHYTLYGVLAEILLIIALKQNIKRLLQGNERIVGLRAKKNSFSSKTE